VKNGDKPWRISWKFKALNFVVGNMYDILTAREKEPLKRKEISISKKISAIYALQEEIEELKFIQKGQLRKCTCVG
jgi:hypothetical protein